MMSQRAGSTYQIRWPKKVAERRIRTISSTLKGSRPMRKGVKSSPRWAASVPKAGPAE